jgi:urease accessory protein
VCPTTGTEAVVEIARGGVRGLRAGARLAPRVLSRGRVVRVALVPLQAGPLAGDVDRLRLHVGAGETLVTVPVAATLALPGAARSRLELHATIDAGGALVLDEPPLIVAEGADVVRRTRLDLAAGAVAAIRDVVVLGRAGERPGRLDAELRATLAGEPLLHDALLVDPAADDGHVARRPGDRVLGTACLLGVPGEPALHGPGALRRAAGADVPGVEVALTADWERWAQLVTSASRTARGSTPSASSVRHAPPVSSCNEASRRCSTPM